MLTLKQIFAVEIDDFGQPLRDNIRLESVLVQNPRLIVWSEPNDAEEVFELPVEEFDYINKELKQWNPDSEIKVALHGVI